MLNISDIKVPGIVPKPKEKVRIVKVINFFNDSLFFLSNALNSNIPTVLILPVHIVVLNPVPRQSLNKHN